MPRVLLEGRWIALLVAAGLVLCLATACKQTNDRYCCTSGDCEQIVGCDDPALPFCDNEGEFPASNGVGRTCIGDPLQTDCDGPNDCTNPDRPFCIDGACRECEDAGDCAADAPACDPDTYLCGACTIDDDCEEQAGTPRCFVDEGVCVACLEATEATDCATATAPVCDAADHSCRGCRANAECASEVCFDDNTGECPIADDVIYVDDTGSGSACTQAAPCATIALGLAQVTGSRNVIKVRAGTYAAQVNLTSVTVTIVGEPGTIIRPGALDQAVVLVSNGANVTLDGLTIRDAAGTGTPVGLLCSTTGATPTITMRGTTVTSNSGGGVSLTSCNFSLTNNWIIGNGNATTATLGGVAISNVSGAGTRVLDFNTIYENTAGSGVTPGVTCSSVVTALSFGNNIIFNNEAADQVSGANCGYTYSNIGPTMATGTGNINTAPTFVDAGNGDYHLESTSAGVDVADPAATLATDIDDDARPQGAERDMGADEVVP